jgi:hypothetical protein
MQTQTDAQRRKSQRERTAKSRAKRKERSAAEVAADEERRFEEFNQYRRTERLVMPGEVEAFQNAEDCEAALAVARQFLAALGQADVRPGESLIDVERRVTTAWCVAGAGLLNRNTLKIDTSTASTIDGYTFDFDTKWIPLEGADVLIDTSTLLAIEIPAVVEVPTVEVPAQAATDDPAFKNYRTPELDAMIKATQAAIDTDARRISAKNLQRETEREKRLGVGYAYDAE